MIILRKLIKFPVPPNYLVMLYCQIIRSILEFNSSVWFSSITDEEADDLERVQKNAWRVILKDRYEDYETALNCLNLQNLRERRKRLALKFGKKCLQIEEMKGLLQESKKTEYNLRNQEQFDVKFAAGQRLYKSAIPTIQRLMNKSV